MTSFPDEKMIEAGWIDKEDVDPGEIFVAMLTDYRTRTGIDVADVISKLSAGTHVLAGASAAAKDVLAERERQKSVEGWTEAHDDEHYESELALAAGAYCESAAKPKILARSLGKAFAIPNLWPRGWGNDWWKPKNPRADLVRAGALIIAEIERLDRVTIRTAQEKVE